MSPRVIAVADPKHRVANTSLVLAAIAATLLSGCRTIPESAKVPERTWRAFEASGHKNNRLLLHNKEPLTPEIHAALGRIVVIATNGGPALDAQRPLSRGKGAWRGAKLWLGWEKSRPAWRLAQGRFQPEPRDHSAGGEVLSGLNGEGALAVAIGYVLYMPVGGTLGALSGAVSVPSKATVEQAVGVISNAVTKLDPQQVLAGYVLAAFERGVRVRTELTASGAETDGVSVLQLIVDIVRLEGGVKANPKLWLSVGWSAQLYSADSSAVIYSTGGVWQSNETRNLKKWAAHSGADLEKLLDEACRQIAAVLIQQVGSKALNQDRT